VIVRGEVCGQTHDDTDLKDQPGCDPRMSFLAYQFHAIASAHENVQQGDEACCGDGRRCLNEWLLSVGCFPESFRVLLFASRLSGSYGRSRVTGNAEVTRPPTKLGVGLALSI
jgi:hypothetical protein